MDDNRSPFFPPEALAQIRKGKVFSGGIRHKEIVGPLLPAGAEWISITVPLDRVFSRYEEIFTRFERRLRTTPSLYSRPVTRCSSVLPIP